MDGRIEQAEKAWQAEKETLDNRPQLPERKEHLPRTEVQLGGFGGQGIISAGRIVGLAAAIYDGLEACFTQSYGPEARGGAAGSQVILASEPIHHPHLIQPTSMIIMSQGAYTKYVPTLAADGLLLIDDSLVTLPPEHRQDIKTLGFRPLKLPKKLATIVLPTPSCLGSGRRSLALSAGKRCGRLWPSLCPARQLI